MRLTSFAVMLILTAFVVSLPLPVSTVTSCVSTSCSWRVLESPETGTKSTIPSEHGCGVSCGRRRISPMRGLLQRPDLFHKSNTRGDDHQEESDATKHLLSRGEGDASSGGSKNICVGSSFSPTNCNSPDSQVINVSPSINVSPNIATRGAVQSTTQSTNSPQPTSSQTSSNTCVGSSFSPTNCNSPGSQRIDVAPNIDVSPSINLRMRELITKDD